jgi:hypothetical protein
LIGRLVGLFLADVLEDAITEMELLVQSTDDLLTIYQELQEAQDADYATFEKPLLPSGARSFPLPDDVDPEIFFRGKNTCHTSLLPAESRHLGYVTNSDEKVGFLGYEKAQTEFAYAESKGLSGPMKLVADGPFMDLTQLTCPALLQLDHKDYFSLHHQEESKWLVVPTDYEERAYGKVDFVGHVMICSIADCQFGGCQKGMLFGADLVPGTAEMEINGIPVTSVTTSPGTHCFWAGNKNGHSFPAGADGRYNITARVLKPGGFFQFTSVAIW